MERARLFHNTMKIIPLFLQLALLTAFYGAGLLLQMLTELPIPGSIFGLLLLFAALKLHIVPENWVIHGATFLQKYIPLFLVPATVGGMNYFHVFTGGGQWLICIVIFSTLLTMVLSGKVTQWIAKLTSNSEEAATCSKSFLKQP
ncbi:Antiholin-like protein LrgA [compost metagenome]